MKFSPPIAPTHAEPKLELASENDDLHSLHAIVVMVHSFGLAVMAEGVETEAQWHFLVDQGCGYFQGFLSCPPLPLDELESFMCNHLANSAR